MTIPGLPDAIQLDEPVRISAESDLRADGAFGAEWLLVTPTRILVYAQHDGDVEQRWDLPLSEVSEPKAENFIGGGALEVTHAERRVELIRYSNSRAPRFATVVHLLEKWLKGEDEPIPEEEQQRCPKCGFPLEKGTRVCPACAPRSRTLSRLVGYMRAYWLTAVMLSSLAILNTALGLVPPYLNKPLMDQVLAPHNGARSIAERLRLLVLLSMLLLLVHIVKSVVGMAQSWLSAWLGNHITHDIRCDLYRHLQFLSLSFFDKRQMGTIISRVNQDTGQLQQFLVWGSQDLAINFLLLVGIGVMLFVMSWKLALIVFIPAPFIALMSSRFWKRIRYFFHRFFRRWGRVNAELTESLNGLRVVKAFAQEKRQITRFNGQSQQLTSSAVHLEVMWSFFFSGITLLIMLGTLMVWYWGGRDVLFGNMTMGTLFAFLMYVGMFYSPIQSLSMLLNMSSRSLTAAERVFEVIDTRPEVEEDEEAVPLPRIEGRVEFRDVTFGYERHRPVVKGISFMVEPGEMIGLVGHSGAGKSTTINLMCRFYDTVAGEVLIDGVSMRKLRLEDLRQQIGLVPQDTFLFSGSIAENIAYAKPHATREEIVRAAKVANAHDFIRQKPDGYETVIGEGGKGLSGGEMQRLAIARAVLHNPRILILDEATSHVDVETEKQVQEAIARLVKGRTTFAIAHRLSTLKNADRLLVLKEGLVAEMGTHDELLAKEDGEFRRLVQTYQEISKVQAVAR